MKTQIEIARDGIISAQMTQVATEENISPELIRDRVVRGEIVIPCNPYRKNQKAVGIGTGLRTKVNASIGHIFGYLQH